MSPYVLEVLCRCLYLFYLHDRLQRLFRSCYSHFHVDFATYFFFLFCILLFTSKIPHWHYWFFKGVVVRCCEKTPHPAQVVVEARWGQQSWVDFFSGLSPCNALFLLLGLPYYSTTLTKGYIIPILEEGNWIMGSLPCSYVGILQLKQYFSSGPLKPFPHGHFYHPNMNHFLDPTLTPCPFFPKRGDQQLHLKENEEK